MRKKILFCWLLIAGAFPAMAQAPLPAPVAVKDKALTTKAEGWLKNDRTGFIENKGQIKDQLGKPNPLVKYLLNMPGLNVQLRNGGFSYDAYIPKKDKHGKEAIQFHRVDISLEGADQHAQLLATDAISEVTNHITDLGEINGIRSYKKVTYLAIYPGIDLEFVAKKGTDKPVEYNFIIHPGADASQIKMHYNNGSDIALKDGKINMKLAFGTLQERIPASFTRQDGKSLAVQYKAMDETHDLYAFNIPDYDKSKTLVIDPTPTVVWATYYGGAANDPIYNVAVDASGKVYVSGSSGSSTNIASSSVSPITGLPVFQSVYGGGTSSTDVYIACFTATGTRLWGTYFGGNSNESGVSMALSGSSIYVVGSLGYNGTQTYIPGTVGQTAPVASADAFAAKFSAVDGTKIWNTYWGGVNNDNFYAISATSTDSLFIAGTSTTGGLTTTGPAFTGGTSGVLLKLSGAGIIAWSRYFGVGATNSTLLYSLVLDKDNNPYVGGQAGNLPANYTVYMTGTAQPTEGQVPYGTTDQDALLARFNGATGALTWARLYGGNGSDLIHCIALDKTNDCIYTTGRSFGPVVVTPGAFQTAKTNTITGFLAKFNLNGYQQWGTYLGEATGASTSGSAVTVDNAGNCYVAGTGIAGGSNLTTDCTYQFASAGGTLFLDKFSPAGTRLWGSYIGIGGEAIFTPPSRGLVIDPISNSIYIGITTTNTGSTLSTPGAWQAINSAGTNEGVLMKLREGYTVSDFTVSANTLTPTNQTACILGVPVVITGTAMAITNADPGYKTPLTYQWQSAPAATGPWTDMPGETSKDLQPPAASVTTYYRRLAKVNTNYCNYQNIPGSESPVAVVTVNTNNAPIANANGPQWYLCNSSNTITLNGTASPAGPTYTYQWYAGNTTTPFVSTASTGAITNITVPTTYTLKITNTATGCSDIDQTTVVPVPASAGPAAFICGGAPGVQIGTIPVASPDITYSWSPTTGLSCATCAQPIATVAGTYTLTVSVKQKDLSTCTSTSAVTVTAVAPPNNVAAFAGADQVICKNGTAVLGATAEAGVTYVWTPGQYLSNSNVAQPTFSAGTASVICNQNYVVTAIKGGCTFTDEVNVAVLNAALKDAGTTAGTAKCGPLWEDGAGDGENCGTATYSWSVISGTGSILQTRNGGKGAYLSSPSGVTQYRRTVSMGSPLTTCTDDIYVQSCAGQTACDFHISTIATQGCPKVFPGGPSFKLTTDVSAADYNFTWSPAGMVDSTHAATVTVTSAANATISVTITNKYDPSITCTKSIVVNNPSWSLPVFATQNLLKCPSTTINIGSAAVTGFTYLWSPATGLDNATFANPTTNTGVTQNYSVTVTEAATGCKVMNTINVGVNPVIAITKPDRTVCSGGTYTLGTPRPAQGANWTYSWQPSAAAWASGSGPTDAQPQVVFASASQTFTLTVTDPVSGCTATDNVTLKSTVTAGEFAGNPATACEGAQLQLGASGTADPLASYNWYMANGTTPATGLSSNTVANPTLTVPGANTTYVVKVGYPGCSLPAQDQVAITVNAATGFVLADQATCPATATTIGIGTAGNSPASLSNVSSYTWSPATGLSATNIANPTTNATTPTTYTLKVLYTNGCTRSDDLLVTPGSVANAKPDVAICLGESTQIGTPAVNGTATYSWTPTTDFVGPTNIAQPTVKPTSVGVKTYTVAVTTGGCVATDAVNVTVTTPADFTISGNTTICEGGTTTLAVTSTIPASTSWQWSPLLGVASPNSTSTLISALDTTTYRLTQTNTATGCSNYKEVSLVVKPNNIAVSTTDAGVCSGVTTGMSAVNVLPAGTYQYVWSPSTGLSSPYIANPTVTTGANRIYTVTVTDNTSKCQVVKSVAVTINPATACYPPVTLTGNIYHDANALKDASVNTTSAIAIPSGLYVTLVDSAGNAVKTVAVAANGTYDFGVTPAGIYSIVMNQNPAGSTVPNPPAGWVSIGENMGAGTGSDEAANGVLTSVIVTATNVANANFGIQQPPVADPKSYLIDQPTINQTIPLNGTMTNTGSGTSSPNQLTGSDPEDGTLNGSGNNRTLYITELPNHGALYYNGVLVTLGQKIANYDPSLLSVKLTGTGYTDLTFRYAYEDNGGAISSSVPYSINWGTPLPVTLVSFEARKVGTVALLEWMTSNEQSSDHFVVERSMDAKVWSEQGRVKAAGSSNAIRSYRFTDDKPQQSINYYRIRMVDHNGSYRVSETRQLAFGDVRPLSVSIAPNPTTGYTVIHFSRLTEGNVKLTVWNSVGQAVKEVVIQEGMQQYELSLETAAGLYLIGIDGSGLHEQLKLTVR